MKELTTLEPPTWVKVHFLRLRSVVAKGDDMAFLKIVCLGWRQAVELECVEKKVLVGEAEGMRLRMEREMLGEAGHTQRHRYLSWGVKW